MFGLKSYLYGAIALAALTLAIMGFRWFTGIQAENTNLKEAVAEYSIQVNALTIEKKSNEALIESLERSAEMAEVALRMVNTSFTEIRDIRSQQQRVLEGSRLGRLAAAKAGLIEGQSNAATARRLAEFEGVINENF